MGCEKRCHRLKAAGLVIGAAVIVAWPFAMGPVRDLAAARLIRHYEVETRRRRKAAADREVRRRKETEARVRAEFFANERVVNPETVGGRGDIRILTSGYAAGVSQGFPEPTYSIVLHPDATNGSAAQDDAARINEAIRTATPPAEITLRAGIYRIQRPIVLKSGVVLRGEGIRKTILLSTRPGYCVLMCGTADPTEVDVRAGATRGSDLLEVADATGFAPGDILKVTAARPDGKAEYRVFRGQVVRLEAVEPPAGLHLDRPLRISFQSPTGARVRRLRPIRFAGLEALTIEKCPPDPQDANAAVGHTITVDKAVDCRIRDCELSHARTSHIWVTDSARVTVEGCYLHHGWSYAAGFGYGICLADYVSDCLVINNTFDTLRHAMIVKAGANGNVFAYNFSVHNNPQRNKDDSCDFSAHGFYAHANLVEGNVLQFAQSSDHFGPSGPLMTFFRNRVEGTGILITCESHFPVIVGNTFERGGVYLERGTVGVAAAGNLMQSDAIPDKIIYNEFRVLRQDEADYPAGFPRLIPSLFLSKEPAFLEGIPWPCFGPDVSEEVLLPAERRYHELCRTLSPGQLSGVRAERRENVKCGVIENSEKGR